MAQNVQNFIKKEEIYHKLEVEFIKNYNLLEETHGKNSTTSKNEEFFQHRLMPLTFHIFSVVAVFLINDLMMFFCNPLSLFLDN